MAMPLMDSSAVPQGAFAQAADLTSAASASQTPAGANTPMQGVAVPDWKSPNAKRPRAKQADAEQGTSVKALSPEELTSAVTAIQSYLESTAGAVEWNCGLLNALVSRVNSV